ncbi:MAG TPA: alpha-glucosidase [Candidatus Egerieimonas faecigallinarum]|nr:alpha-glucosidase [Candidatus Egerieimonas faecigallinarum]
MEKKWWQDKVAYQIYPKSFCDSNGDGIGDLKGIISRLDYLKELGVDIIWLSPIYQSPLVDQGYDISDYYSIDPRFGTMEDMDELLAEAKKRDMYIVMDLVVNHCSDQHEWFRRAMEDPDGEYGKYFYIREGKDGKAPCNWRSYFGGSVWEPVPGHENKYYLHLFAKEQPDLNWENPKLRKEIYKMINWWLDKGLAGFRIDAIINIKKDLRFQDFETDREDGLSDISLMLQQARGVGEFLHEMKQETFAKYGAFTVGEVCNEKPEELPEFIGEDGHFSTMFDFNEAAFGASDKGWYDRQIITAEDYKRCCFEAQRKVSNIGFLSNIIENHDEPRGVSHYLPAGEVTEDSKKMLGGLNFLLRGLPFIYQGQELGMENCAFEDISEINDISTLDQYQVALDAGLSEKEAFEAVREMTRDNARTPFPWSDEENAGFTSGTPWLKINPDYVRINAREQMGREDSVFHFYQKLIALRKSAEYGETVVYGACEPVLEEQKNLMAYYRKGSGHTLLVMGNYQKEGQSVRLPKAVKKVLLNNKKEFRQEGDVLLLDGYQFLVLEVE